MERMSARSCEQWRHAAALDALGGLEDDERAGLLAHLDGCAASTGGTDAVWWTVSWSTAASASAVVASSAATSRHAAHPSR